MCKRAWHFDLFSISISFFPFYFFFSLGNYDLDSEFISVRQQYFQTTRELESKVEGAGKKVVAQSEAADKARAELVEAKKKIDLLESRIRLRQESLDIKTNRVVDAQAAEAESGATVKRLRSEIDEVTVQYREMEAELATKEAEWVSIVSISQTSYWSMSSSSFSQDLEHQES